MADLSGRTTTFLFASIEGAAGVSEQLGSRYAGVLAEFQRMLRVTAHNQDGREIGAHGDGAAFAFDRARDALVAAVAALRAVRRYPWPAGVSLPARMGLYTGEAIKGHTGVEVDRAACICAAGYGGQILVSQATYDLVADNPPREIRLRDLGRHRLKDLREAQTVFQVDAAGLPAEFPPLRSLDAFPNNLPRQVTSFIGREREMAEVKRLLSATCLLTLTGAGGCGKTRLALQVAADLLERYPDGVWLVDLASLSDPTLVPQTVASALGVPEQPKRSLNETLVDYLRPRALLLILDNCEHLLPGCAELTDAVLRTCPGLLILATSREPLLTAGEVSWRVPSLSLPDPGHLPALDRLTEYEAVRLFAERARAALPAFAVTNRNGRAVTQACHRVDGIPLAIELAAARVKMLDVEQIVARLDDRFRLLTRGDRTAPPRQQTLQATMDWSYNLLSERERVLLRRLAVFAGGWTLEAAEAVCAGGGLQADQILDMLTSLVDKSLVLAEPRHGEARYRLLETVRQYGRDRMLDSHEADDLQRRHRDWYLALAEEAEPVLRGPRAERLLERLETEHDNLRAALQRCKVEKDGAEAGLRLTGTLGWFWYRHDHWAEGLAWTEGALARSSEAPPSFRPRALAAATEFAWRRGDYRLARTFGEEGLTLCRELGDKKASGTLLFHLGILAMVESDYQRATVLFDECLNVSHELANKWLYGVTLSQLGIMAHFQGDDARATRFHTQALAALRDVGDKFTVAYALSRFARDVALRQRHYDQASAIFVESLILSSEAGNRWVTEECLEGLARVASAQGHYERAAWLFGAAEVLRETIGWYPAPPDRADHDQCVASARTGLGETAFAAAWAEGRTMTFEQVIEHVVAGSKNAVPTAQRKELPGSSETAGLLTAREREVAKLVARGFSNPEIAARLVITVRTAQTHVQNILNKLGVTSRAQIAAWAVEHGLHTPEGPRQ